MNISVIGAQQMAHVDLPFSIALGKHFKQKMSPRGVCRVLVQQKYVVEIFF